MLRQQDKYFSKKKSRIFLEIRLQLILKSAYIFIVTIVESLIMC